MSHGKKDGHKTEPLRRRSGKTDWESFGHELESTAALSPEAARRMLQELQANQLELELQNEELRRLQEDIEESRERYFEFYNLAPVGYLTLNAQGQIVEANITIAVLLGVELRFLIGQKLTHFILPQDQDIYYLHVGNLFANDAACSCELRLVKKSGDSFWIRIEATRASDSEAGKLCRAVINDITAQKQTEEVLRETSRYSRSLIEASLDPLVTISAEGKITDVNAATETITGVPREKIIGSDFSDYFTEPAMARASYRQMFEQGKVIDLIS